MMSVIAGLGFMLFVFGVGKGLKWSLKGVEKDTKLPHLKRAGICVVAGFVVMAIGAGGMPEETTAGSEASIAPPATLTAKLSPKAKQLVAQSWPKINKACPGLTKYAGSYKFEEVSDALGYPDEEYRKVTVKILLPEQTSKIPGEYHFWGHSCYLDISPAGDTLTVRKDPCISVLLDKAMVNSGRNFVIPLI